MFDLPATIVVGERFGEGDGFRIVAAAGDTVGAEPQRQCSGDLLTKMVVGQMCFAPVRIPNDFLLTLLIVGVLVARSFGSSHVGGIGDRGKLNSD